MKRHILLTAFVALAAIGTSGIAQANCGGCGSAHSHDAKADMTRAAKKIQKMDIVETAVKAGTFKTLVAAVQAAGLVETLQGEGPFTVFAPSDDAFAKLPDGTVEALLKDKKKLTAILTYHVVPGKVTAADVVKLKSATTANGQDVTVKVSDEHVMIDNAKVVATDIVCDNGIIHVIDNVILPN